MWEQDLAVIGGSLEWGRWEYDVRFKDGRLFEFTRRLRPAHEPVTWQTVQDFLGLAGRMRRRPDQVRLFLRRWGPLQATGAERVLEIPLESLSRRAQAMQDLVTVMTWLLHPRSPREGEVYRRAKAETLAAARRLGWQGRDLTRLPSRDRMTRALKKAGRPARAGDAAWLVQSVFADKLQGVSMLAQYERTPPYQGTAGRLVFRPSSLEQAMYLLLASHFSNAGRFRRCAICHQGMLASRVDKTAHGRCRARAKMARRRGAASPPSVGRTPHRTAPAATR